MPKTYVLINLVPVLASPVPIDNDQIGIALNRPLIDALKNQQVKDIYFFTDDKDPNSFNLEQGFINDVTNQLAQEGLTVHGAMVPADVMLNAIPDNKVQEFYQYFEPFVADTTNLTSEKFNDFLLTMSEYFDFLKPIISGGDDALSKFKPNASANAAQNVSSDEQSELLHKKIVISEYLGRFVQDQRKYISDKALLTKSLSVNLPEDAANLIVIEHGIVPLREIRQSLLNDNQPIDIAYINAIRPNKDYKSQAMYENEISSHNARAYASLNNVSTMPVENITARLQPETVEPIDYHQIIADSIKDNFHTEDDLVFKNEITKIKEHIDKLPTQSLYLRENGYNRDVAFTALIFKLSSVTKNDKRLVNTTPKELFGRIVDDWLKDKQFTKIPTETEKKNKKHAEDPISAKNIIEKHLNLLKPKIMATSSETFVKKLKENVGATITSNANNGYRSISETVQSEIRNKYRQIKAILGIEKTHTIIKPKNNTNLSRENVQDNNGPTRRNEP